MSSIPEEIYFEILLKVPVKSLLACKRVCKAWFSLISSRDFVKTHLNLTIQGDNPSHLLTWYDSSSRKIFYYSISHDICHPLELLSSTDRLLHSAMEIDYPFKSSGYSVQFMGCCDGLVCLWFHFLKSLCLWNPATREYKELPKSNRVYVAMVVFGYDCKSNNYKLLAGDCRGLFEVYSLGSNSWKTIESVPYRFPYRSEPSEVIVNGLCHRLAKRKGSYGVVAVSMDMSNEIFNEIELPKEPLGMGFELRNLGVLEGCLCVYANAYWVHCEVWVMQNYRVPKSWTKRFVITDERISRYDGMLIRSFKSGTILFEVSGKLVEYDPKKKSAMELNIHGSVPLYQESSYFESLVSLNSGTYVGRG